MKRVWQNSEKCGNYFFYTIFQKSADILEFCQTRLKVLHRSPRPRTSGENKSHLILSIFSQISGRVEYWSLLLSELFLFINLLYYMPSHCINKFLTIKPGFGSMTEHNIHSITRFIKSYYRSTLIVLTIFITNLQ